MSWVEIRVTGAKPVERDAIIAALIGAGAAGVIEDGDALTTFVDRDADFSALDRALGAASNSAQVVRADAADIDWSTKWPARVGIQRVGLLTVAPPWLADDAGDAALAVIIEPAMAFGTGEHETTRGVLRLMQQVIRAGDFAADLGAGSAVLSIAAAKLGAARVAAVELDHDAIANAEENVLRNGVHDRVTVIEGDAALILPLLAPVRVIMANIISSVLLELSRAMRAALAPGGSAILSGMLLQERNAMRTAFEAGGWIVGEEDAEGDWWSVVVTPR